MLVDTQALVGIDWVAQILDMIVYVVRKPAWFFDHFQHLPKIENRLKGMTSEIKMEVLSLRQN